MDKLIATVNVPRKTLVYLLTFVPQSFILIEVIIIEIIEIRPREVTSLEILCITFNQEKSTCTLLPLGQIHTLYIFFEICSSGGVRFFTYITF